MDIQALFDAAQHWDAGPINPVGKSSVLFERRIAGKMFQFAMLDQETRWDLGLEMIEIATLLEPLIKMGIAVKDMMDKAAIGEWSASQIENAKRDHVIAHGVPMLSMFNDARFKNYIRRLWQMAEFEDGQGVRAKLNIDNVAETAFAKDLTLRIPVALSVMEVNLKEGFLQSPIALSLLAKLKSEDPNSENTSENPSKENTPNTKATEAT